MERDGVDAGGRRRRAGWPGKALVVVGAILVGGIGRRAAGRATAARVRDEQREEALSRLAGSVAHEFNNALAVVVGGLELAQRQLGEDGGAVARHLDDAREGADRAAALARRLLAFGDEAPLDPEPVDVAALVGGLLDPIGRTLGDAVTLVTQLDCPDWRVRADRVQLQDAILEIVANARDAMDGGGILTVATRGLTLAEAELNGRGGDHLLLSVTDTGRGMAPDVAERAIEPFFTTGEAGKRVGLGLTQAAALVRQLGGEIAIASVPGKGTSVTLTLPRDADVGADPTATAAARGPGELQVLVVEDDPRVLAATVAALKKLGHRGIACDDPRAAPALLDEHREVGLILSDVRMPRQTGPEMIAALPPRFAHIAVMFVTGYAGDADPGGFGDRPVLRKPFTLAGLERAIDAALGRDAVGG